MNHATSSPMYRRGYSFIDMHKRKMVRGRARSVTQVDRTVLQMLQKEGKPWLEQPEGGDIPKSDGGSSASTHGLGPRYSVELEALVTMPEQQLWLTAVGGKNKGRVCGLSFETHISSQTYTSPSPPLATTTIIPGHGGLHRPTGDDNDLHDSHDEGDVGQLLVCWTITTDRPRTTSDIPPAPNNHEMDDTDEEGLD
ncbi:UNVERIFIED_CONTAM: hypothetical protein Sindi_2557200 [Sesamum indicum]